MKRLLSLAALLAFVAACPAPSNKEPAMPKDASHRYYQVVLIQVNDGPKFGRYLDLMRPIVARYGGALERMLAPQAIYAAMPKPEIINIVYYDDEGAFHAFNRDPEFVKIEHLRAESITMASVGGLPVAGEVSERDLAARTYLVEIARYRAGLEGYREYERAAAPMMGRHGYHVERILDPRAASGFSFEPNVVRIAYFDHADGLDAMQNDPDHERLDALYATATTDSVWIVGRVHPSTLPR